MKYQSSFQNLTEPIWTIIRNSIPMIVFVLIYGGCVEPNNEEKGAEPSNIDKVLVSDSLNSNERGLIETEVAYKLPYDLMDPENKVKLPDKLEEVSGLSYLGDQTLAMVQDEKGKIYIFDMEKEEISDDHKFGTNGDYEALEIIDNIAYVMKSDGVLYEVKDYSRETPPVRKFKTPLSSRNDVEGLGFLEAEGKLLIACKNSPGIRDKTYRRKRAIYSFNLEDNTFDEEPFILIDLEKLRSLLMASAKTSREKEKARDFDPSDRDPFQPSGVAVNPVDGHYYVIASSGKMMVVLNKRKRQFMQLCWIGMCSSNLRGFVLLLMEISIFLMKEGMDVEIFCISLMPHEFPC